MLALGLRLLRQNLRLGLIILALLQSVNEVGMFEIFILVGVAVDILLGGRVRIFDHLDLGVGLRRVKLAFIIGNSEAAGQLGRVGNLLDLGDGIEPRAGEGGLAGSFPAWRLGEKVGKRPTFLKAANSCSSLFGEVP